MEQTIVSLAISAKQPEKYENGTPHVLFGGMTISLPIYVHTQNLIT